MLEELVATVGEHNPDVDRDLLEHAFAFACEAHRVTSHARRADSAVPGYSFAGARCVSAADVHALCKRLLDAAHSAHVVVPLAGSGRQR